MTTPEQRRTLADLLIQWEDLYKQGQDTPADVLGKDHPELAETLARQIAALKRVSWLDKKLEDGDDDPAADTPDDPRPTRVLAGRYRLDELIATGGFAEVWRAFDQELQRIIAVKIPKRTVIGAADSFLAEARRVARLKHPSILPVYDVGIEGDDCFFVSEYVEGGSLADRLIAGKLPVDQACRWIASIADALNHAHAAGVIHRDIKPGNILIDSHDRVLLADFGIAQSSMKTGEFAPSLGTLRYMAPEQLDGQAAVPQSDIYSLAVVLHETLTGRPPYSSGEPNTLRREIVSGAKVSRDVPSRLAPVLRKALNKDPGQPFSSAAEFASAVRKASRPSSWGFPLAVAPMVSGLLLFLILRPKQPAPASISDATDKPATTAVAIAPPVSPISADDVLRREMPYPLPPLNRRRWDASSSDEPKSFRFNAADGWWAEFHGDDRYASFTQTRITDDRIELAGIHYPVWLRIKDSQCEWSTTSDYQTTSLLAQGEWANSEASPLPAEFDKTISLVAGRDTLANYLRSLSQMTGVPIVINLTALQAEGITKNQSFGMDAHDQPARQVLQTILSQGDSEGRLRAVLRGTDNGGTAVDITTKQALGE
jgi:serine/threonine protein kinase